MSSYVKKNLQIVTRATKISLLALCILTLIACSGKTPEERILAAQASMRDGDTRTAIIELKSAIQEAPRLAEARFELGKIYLADKDFDSAEKELSKALELRYSARRVIPLLAEAFHRSGANVALAQLNYEDVNLSPDEKIEVGFRQVKALLALEKEVEARFLIDDLSVVDSDSVYKDLVAAHRFLIRKDYVTALEKAQALYEREPLNRDVLGFVAGMNLLNDNQAETVAIYEEYTKVANDAIELKFALANMLVEQGELERANVYIDELMQINDSNGFLNYLKSVIHASYKEYPDALEHSETAIRFGYTDPKVRLIAGFSAYRVGEFSKAAENLLPIQDILVDEHIGLRILAESLLRSDSDADMSRLLGRLEGSAQEDAAIFSQTASKLLREGKVAEAKALIKQSEQLDVSVAELRRLGALKLSVRDADGLRDLEQALKDSPESSESRAILGAAYLRSGLSSKAMALAKEWQTSLPSDINSFILEAQVLQQQRKLSEAKQVLDKASDIAPENEKYLLAVVRVNMLLKDINGALAATETLLENAPNNVIGLASFFAIKREQEQAEVGLERIAQAYQQNTKNQELALLLARTHLGLNDAQSSIAVLNNIEAKRSAPSKFWSLKGEVLIRNQQFSDAEQHYDEWIALFPLVEQAVISQLGLLDTLGNAEKALGLTQAFLAEKESVRVSILQAHFYALTNDFNAANKVVNTIDEDYHSLPIFRGIKARIALSENRPDDALDDALAAYQSDNKTHNLLLAVKAMLLTGNTEGGDQLLRSHLTKYPNDMQAKSVLAETLIIRDIDAAISLYKEILLKQENNVMVLNNVAYLLTSKNELDEAEDFAARGFAIDANSVAMADTYAQVLVKKEQYEKAVDVYNQVGSSEINDETIYLNYINALLLNGSSAIAKRRLASKEFVEPLSKTRILILTKDFDL